MADQTNAGQMPGNSYVTHGQGLGKPVDRAQERYRPSPHYARRVPPHAGVPDDKGEHTLTSRVLVYGGAAIAAAALTAAAVMTVRKVADLVTGDDEIARDADREAERARARVWDANSGRRSPAPRFAGPAPHPARQREREAMRARTRDRLPHDEDHRPRKHDDHGTPRPRPDHDDHRPARPARPRPQANEGLGLVGDIEHTAQSLTRNINGVVAAITSAFAAFRTVSDQAEGIVRQFHGTADAIRGFLDDPNRRSAAARDQFRRPSRRDAVDLRDDQAQGTQARAHRL